FTIPAGGAANAEGLASAVAAINDVTSKTGVTAQLNDTGDGIELVNATGNNITIEADVAAGNLTVGGIDVPEDQFVEVTGQIVFDSDKSFSVSSDNENEAVDVAAGGTATAELQKVSDLNVTDVESATKALAIVDSALSAINGLRAKFGALQSRFESTISNLQTTSTNLSAANSRIMDADFATESAELARTQVLQQAGISVLSQANAQPQQVLKLLQG